MFKFIDTSEVNAVLEEMFKRYNFVLRDMEPNVPRVTEYPYIPGYKNCQLIYDSESYFFCIYSYNKQFNHLIIRELYAPNQGKKILKALLDHITPEGETIFLIITLEIIDVNRRAKKFWFRELGKPKMLYKSEDWITEYEFEYMHKRKGVSNDW